MKISNLVSTSQFVENFRELVKKEPLIPFIEMNSNGGAQPQPLTGQCHIFLGCNQAYALYPNGDTYQQCVARRRASPSPHSWRTQAGCVDIP